MTRTPRPARSPRRAPRHWLMKSEPSVFSIDDLERAKDRTTRWDGIRNYQVRNLLRDEVAAGDRAIFWHSSADPPGAAGVCEIVGAAYPDPTQFDAKSEAHDPGSDPAAPRWLCIDVRLVRKFPAVVPLERLRAEPALAAMDVLRRGNRLSVQRVTPEEFAAVTALAAVPSPADRPPTAAEPRRRRR